LTTSPLRSFKVALVDANVLFPHHPRNVLVTLAVERVFEMRWSGSIEREWTNALLREQPGLKRDAVLAIARKMNEALPRAGVTDFAKLEANFPKTDVKDRHVAAAAATCAPSALITWNLRDFNKAELAVHNVELTDPDTFLCQLFDIDQEIVLAGTQRAFGFLRRPQGHPTWDQYLDILDHNNHLKKFSAKLRAFGLGDEPPEDDAEENPSPQPQV
jgi:hypothetical protein